MHSYRRRTSTKQWARCPFQAQGRPNPLGEPREEYELRPSSSTPRLLDSSPNGRKTLSCGPRGFHHGLLASRPAMQAFFDEALGVAD